MARTTAIRPTIPNSDSEDGYEHAQTPPKPARRGRDVTPRKQSPLPPRKRISSTKQATTEKENLVALEAQVATMKKKLAKQKALAGAKSKKAKDDDANDDLESEEAQSAGEDNGGMLFSSAIRPLGQLPLPAQKPKVVFRKTKKASEPRTTPRAFMRLPEPTPEQRILDAEVSTPSSPTGAGDDASPIVNRVSSPPRSSSPMVHSSSPTPHSSFPTTGRRGRASPGDTIPAQKRSRSPASSPPPPAKRFKPKPPPAEFREGYVPGVKPKASDYAPVPHALLIRACADYSARIVAVYAFPAVTVQIQWATETFKGACRAAGEFCALSDRMAKIIMARGSQIRGKIIDAYRSLFASHYGFDRSTAKKTIEANKVKAAYLVKHAAFHYKDPVDSEGYGENKIIAAVRKLTTFSNTTSVGVLFSAYFDPISLFSLALDMTALEFCANEWSTGSFIKAKFYEKEVSSMYRVHLADAERWSDLKPGVVENIRRKWYRRASQTLTSVVPLTTATNINEAQIYLLRNELAGRTGDTDSEAEPELAPEGGHADAMED
ncbi:hypothetical protein DFH09DRAFT_1327987 [Mycena vulgaris]|nr:hypothetical protein DFH09DRAFT_1327987 [Mycena vulgaris]